MEAVSLQKFRNKHDIP